MPPTNDFLKLFIDELCALANSGIEISSQIINVMLKHSFVMQQLEVILSVLLDMLPIMHVSDVSKKGVWLEVMLLYLTAMHY